MSSSTICGQTEWLSFWGIGFEPVILTPISVLITTCIAIWQHRHARRVQAEAAAAASGRPSFFNDSASSFTTGRLGTAT
jgi:hypothetical protein